MIVDTPHAAQTGYAWRRSLHAVRRSPGLLIPLFLSAFLLPLADLIPPTPNPYVLDTLQPIGPRTQAICVATTLVGLLVGWVAAGLSTRDRCAGLPLAIPPSFYGFRSLPAHRATTACVVAFFLAASGLVIAGHPVWLSLWLAAMVAIQAATVALFMPVVVRGYLSEVVAVFVLLLIAGASLVAALGLPLKFTTALVPSFWIGHTLSADQIGIDRGTAAFVGVCMNLLPLTLAIGLNLADRDAERKA